MDTPEFKGVVTPDTSKEHAFNRDEVEKAFNDAFDRFKSKEGSLDDEMRWHLKATEDARAKTLEASPKKNNLTIEFDNHPADPPRHYKQAEGIPVDGLLTFLEKELEDPGLTDDQRTELANQYSIIAESSRAYRHATPRGGRSARMQPGRLVARVAYEANLIAGDPDPTMRNKLVAEFRATHGRDPSDDEVLDLHWYKAIDLIDDRRELVIPARTRTTTESPIDEPSTDPLPEDDPPEDPPGDPVEEARYNADVVNFTGLNAERAYTYAQKIVDEKIRGGKWFNVLNWPRTVKYRLTQPYQVYKFQEKLLRGEAIKKSLLTSKETHKRTQTLVDAYRAEEAQERQDVRQRFEALAEGTTARGDRVVELKTDNPEQQALRAKIVTDILTPICDGTITTQEQVQAKLADFVQANLKDSTTLQEIFGPEANNFGKLAKTFATGLLEQGLRIKADREVHGKTMAELDNQIRIRIANAKGLTTDQRGKVAKWIERGERRKAYREADMAEKGRLKGMGGWAAEKSGLAGIVLNPLVVGVSGTLATRGLLKTAGVTGTALQWTPFMVGAVSGGIVGYFRRRSETEADFRRHLVERTKGEVDLEPKQDTLPSWVRGLRAISGGSSRERLEQIAGKLHTASVRDLIDGHGVDQLTGTERKSIAQLIADGDTAGLMRRKAEIIARQRFDDTDADVKKGRSVDLITYETGKFQENLRELDKAIIDVTGACSTAVDGNADYDRLLGEYRQRMLRNRDEMEKDFRRYRLQRSLITGGWGTAAGLGGGLLVHGAVKLAGFRDVGDVVTSAAQRLGRVDVPFVTASAGVSVGRARSLDGIFGAVGHKLQDFEHKVADVLLSHGSNEPINAEGRPNIEQFRQLYDHGGDIRVADDLTVHVNPPDQVQGLARVVSLRDGNGNTVDPAWGFVNEKGHLVTTGRPDQWPEPLRRVVGEPGWGIENQPLNDTNYNLEQRVAEVVREHQQNKDLSLNERSFRWGRFDITVDANNETGYNILKFANRNMGEGYPGTGQEFYAGFRPDGTILFDPKLEANAHLTEDQVNAITQEFKNDRWQVFEEQLRGPDVPQPPATKNVVDYFKDRNEIQKIRFGASHENATPFIPTNAKGTLGIGADGKELQMYERVFTAPDGKKYLQVDISQMRSHLIPGTGQGVNWDKTVDEYYGRIAQDIYPDGRMDNFAVGLQPSAEQVRDRAYIMFDQTNHPEIGRGVLNLNLDDPVTKALFNIDPNGNRVLNQYGNSYRGCFVSTFHRQPDGSYDALARYAGSENLGTIPVPQPPLAGPEYTGYSLRAPNAIEFVPPKAPGPEGAPPIPIPFDWVPRWPLQPTEVLPPPPTYYYTAEMPERTRRMFEQNRSETLRRDPNARLDPYEEVRLYFDRQSPEYLNEIRGLVGQIHEPMSANARAVVCVPVAGHEEGGQIYETLVNYSYQDAPKDQYEILLFVNHPEGSGEDNTRREIERFQREHPDMPVRMIYKQIPSNQAKMSYIRKYLNDVALYRHHQRGNAAGDIILISNDADLKGVSPRYISNFINKFDRDERIDGMVGQLDWDPASYIEYPVIHAGTRLFQYLNVYIWQGKASNRPSSGANFAFRGSIYSGVGGYQTDEERIGAEDVVLGQAIRDARANTNTIGYAGSRVSRLYTSSRRAIAAWKEGFTPIEQWDRRWGLLNGDIRNLELGVHKTVNYDDPDVLEKLKSGLEKVIDGTLDYYRDTDGTKDNALFVKAVSLLGIKYTIGPDGKVKITDMASFVRGIKTYQERGVILKQVKSGKLPKSVLKDLDTTAPPTPEAPAATNVVQQVNERLARSTEATEQYEVNTRDLVRYVESLRLPSNARIRNLNVTIVGDQVRTAGVVNAAGGSSRFNAVFSVSPTGQLQSVSHTINPALRHRPFIRQVENRLTHLNDELTTLLNSQINANWQTAGFALNGDRLALNFRKR